MQGSAELRAMFVTAEDDVVVQFLGVQLLWPSLSGCCAYFLPLRQLFLRLQAPSSPRTSGPSWTGLCGRMGRSQPAWVLTKEKFSAKERANLDHPDGGVGEGVGGRAGSHCAGRAEQPHLPHLQSRIRRHYRRQAHQTSGCRSREDSSILVRMASAGSHHQNSDRVSRLGHPCSQ